MILPNIWKNNPNVPNHQPAIDFWHVFSGKARLLGFCCKAAVKDCAACFSCLEIGATWLYYAIYYAILPTKCETTYFCSSVHPILLAVLAPCFCCCRTTPWETERDVPIDALDGTSKWRPCLAVAVPASANRCESQRLQWNRSNRSTLQIRCRSTKVASADLLCDIIVVNVVIIIAIIMQYHRMQFV